jgi:hypothetical protein
MMEKFDADKDGKLSETERAAAKAAFKEKGGEFRAKVLERFDADKDGKLSETERAAAKEAMKEKGGELRATGRVVKAGRRIIVTSAEVMHLAEDGRETACALMQQTLVPVPKTY